MQASVANLFQISSLWLTNLLLSDRLSLLPPYSVRSVAVAVTGTSTSSLPSTIWRALARLTLSLLASEMSWVSGAGLMLPLCPILTPLAVTDVFVDDFIGLAQLSSTSRRVCRILMHAIDGVLCSLDKGDSPFRWEVISFKKLLKGDCL